jgi:hypothetical protein
MTTQQPDTTQQASELLPCPFCGSAEIKLCGTPRPYWFVMCECGIQDGLSHTKDQARESWNKRTPAARASSGDDAFSKSLERVRNYVAMRNIKPLRGLDDQIHGIHTGTDFEASLTFADLQILVYRLEALEKSK